MGDIATHAQIQQVVLQTLTGELPGEPYEFMELGNWLTDVSQFRDPPSMMHGKLTVWREARERASADPQAEGFPEFVVNWYLSGHTNVPAFNDAMFGTPGTDGALTQFLRHLMYAMGCARFNSSPMAVGEFDSVFQRDYTQYFPHEHMDFPPAPDGSVLGDRTRSRWRRHQCGDMPQVGSPTGPGAGPTRHLLDYLDEQIVYVAELLAGIEAEWKRLGHASTPRADRDARARLLTRFGHALHAVQDFFFHSNFVELAWFRRGVVMEGLPGSDGRLLHAFRIYERRLRAPRSDPDAPSRLSRSASWVAGSLYTGFFGSTDIYHTIADAIDVLVEGRTAIPGPVGILLGNLSKERRRQLRESPGERDRVIDEYRMATVSRQYLDAVDRARRGNDWASKGVQAVADAVEVDRRLHDRFSGGEVPREMCGVFEFLLMLLGRADEEHEKSERQSAIYDSLNSPPGRGIEATDNLASAEVIGSHSLMSKDSPHKEPLRQAAINLATYVSVFVARQMAAQIPARMRVPAGRTDPGRNSGATVSIAAVDWLHVLQHFLSHPDEAEHQWYLAPMLAADERAALQHPAHYSPPRISMTPQVWRVERRLQSDYNNQAAAAEREWQAR